MKVRDMRILILASSVFPKEGGLSTHIRAFKKWMEKSGIYTSIVSLGNLTRFQRILLLWGPSRLLRILPGQSGVVLLLSIVRWFFRLKARQMSARKPFDLVLAQDINAFHAIKTRKDIAESVYIVVHDYFTSAQQIDWNIASDSYEKRYLTHLERTAYLSAQRIITVDSRIAGYIQSNFGINQDKISIIKNAADCGIFQPFQIKERKRTEFRILVPRRLVLKNGVEYAIRALSEPILSDNRFVMILAGEGPEYKKLFSLSKELNVSQRIRFVGSIDSRFMPKLYNDSDVVLIPSVTEKGIQEATSLSALEAMACEIPVIASRIGGLKEIIHNGLNGVLVDERNSEQIANAVHYLYSEPDIAFSMGSKGRISAIKNWNRFGEEIIKMITGI
jgi:glycosyltransferase involved in cell wall biosynthesis